MHEAGIVNNLIEIVNESISPQELFLLDTIEIRIGKMSNVLPEALEFCFHSFVANTPLEHVQLKIEELSLNICCKDCTHIFTSDDYIFSCKECGGSNLEIIGGNELIISKLYLKSESEII